MTKLTVVAALCLPLLFAGCATGPSGGTPSGGVSIPSAQTIQNAITTVQDTANKICGFVPVANTVAQLLIAFNVTLPSQLTAVASQVCAAVTKPGARPGAKRSLKGVVIEGKFTK